jgi:hypothetical protein
MQWGRGRAAGRGGDVIGSCHISEPEPWMQMPRQTPAPYTDDHGWLITPRALTSVATVVGLVYTLHTPVRYVLHLGESVVVLTSRVDALETEMAHQRGIIAAAQLVLATQTRDEPAAPAISFSGPTDSGQSPVTHRPRRAP